MDFWVMGVVIVVVLVFVVLVDVEKLWLVLGDMVNIEVIWFVKDYLVWCIYQQEQKSDDYGNIEMIIVVGVDML